MSEQSSSSSSRVRARRRRRVTILGGAIAAGLITATAVAAEVRDDDATASGALDHSAFTREQLQTFWDGTERFPLYVPLTMPAGAAEYDGVGFTLDNVVADSKRASGRVWVSYYSSDLLGGKSAAFRIFQSRAPRKTDPCGPMPATPFVQRHTKHAFITICSTALTPGSEAVAYWESVDFTSDLEDVTWLRN